MRAIGFGHYGGNWLCGPGLYFPGPFGWIITLLFWGLIIVLAVKLVQWLLSTRSRSTPDPVETLRQRYARGEISVEEYHRMKGELD